MENESLDSNPHIPSNARVSQAPFFHTSERVAAGEIA